MASSHNLFDDREDCGDRHYIEIINYNAHILKSIYN